MTLDKAKDYFSAYYEGSLDRGLKQQFDARIKEDAQLQAEYRAFERTMKELEAFGGIDIEPPEDLHDKIAARLDKAIWEQKRNQKTPAFAFAWWKGLFAVSVAAAVIVGAMNLSGQQKPSSAANIIGVATPNAVAPLKLTFAGGGANGRTVTMNFPSADAKVVVKDSSGRILSSLDLNGREIKDEPLENKNDAAQLIQVEADGTDGVISASDVAIPGKVRDANITGKGTVKDMVTAIAAHYQKPVVIQNQSDGDKPASWDLTSNDMLGAATASLKGLGLSISEDGSGILLIQPN
jgi:hypothetical protein